MKRFSAYGLGSYEDSPLPDCGQLMQGFLSLTG